MTDVSHETIIALASGAGRAGVAVLRLSGPDCVAVWRTLSSADTDALPMPRYAQFSAINHPQTKVTLDQALLLYFPNPYSFTGEDVLELHIHGGRAVMDRVIQACLDVPDTHVRMAQPGEFSQRAVQNGKMDLTQAEGVHDLVVAETEAQAELALAQMGGALRDLYEQWRHDLAHLLAHVEAWIDFADEDLPDDLWAQTTAKIKPLLQAMQAHLNDHHRGERLRDGVSVAIIGAPNAGKSTLLNALARRDAAIVSDIAGTTRDAVEVSLDLGGIPVRLIDTAGLRDTEDPIEQAGIDRARAHAAQADLKLALFASSQTTSDSATASQIDDKTFILLTQVDTAPVSSELRDELERLECAGFYDVSAQTGQGMDALLSGLGDKLTATYQWGQAHSSARAAVLTRPRHRQAVTEAGQMLETALANIDAKMELAMIAEDLRLAMRALGRLTGRVDVEDLLDIVFRDFCIGK